MVENSQVMPAIIVGGVVLLAFAPVIVALAHKSGFLAFLSFALCLIFVVGGVGVALLGGLAVALALPVLGIVWLAALVCGIASFMTDAADRRMHEMVSRILRQDEEGLRLPPDVRKRRGKQPRM